MTGSSSLDSYVLLVDPEGHRFGVDSSGKPVPREIVRGFYEDDDTAEMETNLPAERQPQVMSIDEAASGRYVITVTARRNTKQWLKIMLWTRTKLWKQEFMLSAMAAGTAAKLSFAYDFHSEKEPQVSMNEQPLQPAKNESVVLRP